jgi:hypothetical protein
VKRSGFLGMLGALPLVGGLLTKPCTIRMKPRSLRFTRSDPAFAFREYDLQYSANLDAKRGQSFFEQAQKTLNEVFK